jgi:NAD(P)-dependent dehydrogenase (short-subunit alcohol dehydrogenase family)
MASKTWLITGASRGFGRVWTEAALKRGDLVAATARDVSRLGPLWVTQAVLPVLRGQGHGHIIQVSSVGGVFARPEWEAWDDLSRRAFG